MHKRSIGIRIFGIILLILTLYVVFLSYGKFKLVLSMIGGSNSLLFLIPYFFIHLLGVSYSIIMCIGIFRLKFWAWYLVIACGIIGILALPNKGFILGWQIYHPLELAIKIELITLILLFFIHPKIKEQFLISKNKFKLKSWYATLIGLFLINTLAIPGFVIGYKVFNFIKNKQPFLVTKPKLVTLDRINKSSWEDKFRKIEIFNLSLVVPKDFVDMIFQKGLNEVFLIDTLNNKGFILIEKVPDVDVFTRPVYKALRFQNAYQFEEALYSNNWSLILLILRNVYYLSMYGGAPQIGRFETSTIKGFVGCGYRKDQDKWICYCSIYDKFNNGIGGIIFNLEGQDFSQNKILDIISSIQIPQKRSPEEYYQEGIQLIEKGDFIGAQFAFFNAYYLRGSAEVGYMLAKTILMREKQGFSLIGAKNILKEVLAVKPDYSEAKELLALVEEKLGKREKEESKSFK